jgi:ABC-type transport system involved in cytochrome bd biosynthesis fused ATPase/permease subunit
VQKADIICVMEDGRIIESGSHAELFAKGGVYTNLCRQQFMSGGEGGALAAQVLPIRAGISH